MRAWTVNQDKVVVRLKRGDSGRETVIIDVFAWLERLFVDFWELVVLRRWQVKVCFGTEIEKVLKVAANRFLAQIQIEHRGFVAQARERRGDVHGDR